MATTDRFCSGISSLHKIKRAIFKPITVYSKIQAINKGSKLKSTYVQRIDVPIVTVVIGSVMQHNLWLTPPPKRNSVLLFDALRIQVSCPSKTGFRRLLGVAALP